MIFTASNIYQFSNTYFSNITSSAIFLQALVLGNFLCPVRSVKSYTIYFRSFQSFAISSFSQSSCSKEFKSRVMDRSIFSATKLWLFHVFLLFVFYLLCLNIASGTATDVDYGRHCNSVVHESIPDDEEFNIMPFPGRQNGYFSGGDKVLNNPSHMYHSPESKTLIFETHHVYATKVVDVFKVERNLIFQTSYSYEQSFSRDSSFVTSSSDSSDRGTLDLDFQGF
ncbi:hypothetical protein V6N13_074800 [Hibiscus sabdariffa]